MHLNSIDYIFVKQYMHKYQHDGKGLGKNEQGIVEPITNKG